MADRREFTPDEIAKGEECIEFFSQDLPGSDGSEMTNIFFGRVEEVEQREVVDDNGNNV